MPSTSCQPLFPPEVNDVDARIVWMTADLEAAKQEKAKCDEEKQQAQEVERQVEEVCWVTEEAKRAWKVAEEAKNICQELEQVERVQLEECSWKVAEREAQVAEKWMGILVAEQCQAALEGPSSQASPSGAAMRKTEVPGIVCPGGSCVRCIIRQSLCLWEMDGCM